MFIDQPQNGMKIAKDLKANYILVYVVAQRFAGVNGTNFYTLGSGGDESKKQWFMRIGGFDENNYLQPDGFTATPNFWSSTLLGQLIPFKPQAYAAFQGGQLTNLQPDYRPGTIALYSKDIKYPVGNNPGKQPLSLVYSSPSFQSNDQGLVFAVLIYKVNPNYVPKPTSNPYHEVFVNATQPAVNATQKSTSSLPSHSATTSGLAASTPHSAHLAVVPSTPAQVTPPGNTTVPKSSTIPSSHKNITASK
jgi:dolichyl-diphosphooligosaccharide--protein glycosyltransferase